MATNKVAAQKTAVAAAKKIVTAKKTVTVKKSAFVLETIQRNDLVTRLNAINAVGGKIRFILPNGASWNTYDVVYEN